MVSFRWHFEAPFSTEIILNLQSKLPIMVAHGYIANSVGCRCGLIWRWACFVRLQYETVALVWTPRGHRPSPSAPKQSGCQQPQAISTPPLSVWTSSHLPDRRECSGAPVLGFIDCLFQKVGFLARHRRPLHTISSQPTHLLQRQPTNLLWQETPAVLSEKDRTPCSGST